MPGVVGYLDISSTEVQLVAKATVAAKITLVAKATAAKITLVAKASAAVLR